MKKTINGFTLIELILTIVLISLVITVSVNMMTFANRTHRITVDEYELQSAIRLAAESTNNIVRYSKAVFAVPETFVQTPSNMDSGWSYFMVSSDRKKIVRMEYDADTDSHIEVVVVPERPNVLYELTFAKDETANSDSVLAFEIIAITVDNENKETGKKVEISSIVESVNAMQIVDKGSAVSPAVALAYRSDGQTQGQGKNQIAYVTIIIDVSGSMNLSPDGTGNVNYEGDNARIKHVRKALSGDEDEIGIINQFSEEENVFVSLIPFSTTANYPSPTQYTASSERHVIYEPFKANDEQTLIDSANALIASGGTNTGDALRQAYYLHQDFRTRMNIPVETQVYHYMIMLVDGQTTYEIRTGGFIDDGRYRYYDDNTSSSGNNRYYYDDYRWENNWNFSPTGYYSDRGNISDFIPPSKPYNLISQVLVDSWRTVRRNNYVYHYQYDRYYGEKADNASGYKRTGNGNTVINPSEYVNTIGAMIESNAEPIKSYIIGYATDLSTHIDSIGNALGTDSDKIYAYDDEGFNLQEVFRNIANDIMADFWLLTGPQIN